MNSKNKRQLAVVGWARAGGRALGVPRSGTHGTQRLGSQHQVTTGGRKAVPLHHVQLPVAFVQCDGSQGTEGLMRRWAQPGTAPGSGITEQPSVLVQGA